jgi:hypothetical protein
MREPRPFARRHRAPPGRLDASRDPSLLPPQPQPQFDTRGPLNVVGPYIDAHAKLDNARMRTTPAYFRNRA